MTRGINNKNPGNIRKGSPWVGLAPIQGDGSFCTFIDAEHGIRAMFILLHNYNLSTIKDIITKWAPGNENNTEAYIASVAKRMGVKATDNLVHPARGAKVPKPWTHDKDTMVSLAKAIIWHENGSQPYGQAVFDKAWELSSLA